MSDITSIPRPGSIFSIRMASIRFTAQPVVLNAAGQREQARKIWREGLITAPDNETLLSTLKRLQVQP